MYRWHHGLVTVINSFAQFCHFHIVYLKAFSKAPEFCRCPAMARDWEVSGSKPCWGGLWLYLKDHTALNRIPYAVNLHGNQTCKDSPNLTPWGPSWWGGRAYSSHHALGNPAASFSSPCSSWFLSSQNRSTSFAPIRLPHVSSLIPRAPPAAQQTARGVQFPREQGRGLAFAFLGPA